MFNHNMTIYYRQILFSSSFGFHPADGERNNFIIHARFYPLVYKIYGGK